jgi:outer membrane protein assembly factor BamA
MAVEFRQMLAFRAHGMMRRETLIGSLALLLASAPFFMPAVLAAAPATPQAPQTRAEALRQQRLRKGMDLRPPERNVVERGLYGFREHRVLERYQAGYRGFHPMFGGLSTGSGFALGTIFQKDDIARGALSFSVSGQASFKAYQKYEMNFAAPHLAGDRLFVAFNFRYRSSPQEDYFGIGAASLEDNRTSFLQEDAQYTVSLGVRPARRLALGTRAGYLRNNTGPGTDGRFLSIEQVFTEATAPALERQPSYAFAGAFAEYDSRDQPANPRSGGFYRVEGAYYDDRDFASFSFQRWDVELQRYFPFFNERRVIAVRSRLQTTDANGGQRVPFFLLPVLGGSEDLRGFREFRFRDSNSLIVNLEYRWEVFSGMDMALFGDAGDVVADINDLAVGDFKTSYGFGFRFNTSKSVFLRLDFGFGREGPRTFIKFNHVF